MIQRAMLAVSVAITMTCAASESQQFETAIRLAVPKQVAAEAAARASGDASRSAPVLMLVGVEYTLGERLTIEVLGPRDRKTNKRAILAVSSLVGSNRPPKNAPKEKTDLVVPLNDDGARLIAKKKEVTLTLRLRNARRALKFTRAYLTNR